MKLFSRNKEQTRKDQIIERINSCSKDSLPRCILQIMLNHEQNQYMKDVLMSLDTNQYTVVKQYIYGLINQTSNWHILQNLWQFMRITNSLRSRVEAIVEYKKQMIFFTNIYCRLFIFLTSLFLSWTELSYLLFYVEYGYQSYINPRFYPSLKEITPPLEQNCMISEYFYQITNPVPYLFFGSLVFGVISNILQLLFRGRICIYNSIKLTHMQLKYKF